MKSKKLLSIILALCLIMQVFPVFAANADTTTDTQILGNIRYIINDTFDDGSLGNWKLGGDAFSTLKLSVENGAMKLSAPSNAWTQILRASVRNDFTEKLTFKDDTKIVVKTRMMHNNILGNYSGAFLKLNRPTNSALSAALANAGITSNELNYKWYSAVQISKTGLLGFNGIARESSNAVSVLSNTDMSGKWIDVEMVFGGPADADGKREAYTITLTTTDATGQEVKQTINSTLKDRDYAYAAAGYDVNAEGFKGFESLDSISFVSGESGSNIYVDYVQVYEVSTVVKATVPVNSDYGILYRPDEISLVFDSPIDYTDGGIEITDEMDNIVPHSGSYDETSRTYKATFDSQLTAGNYKFIIKDTISPSPVEGIEGMTFDSRSVPFRVYETLPPVVENLTIDGLIAPGCTVTADYKFVSETDAEDNSICKWFVSESGEEGTFNELTGFNEKTLDITEANAAQKYVMCSVIPQADGLTGTERFSNILIPEAAPVISNLKLSSTNLFFDSYLTAVYQFNDVNDDAESGTSFEWFTSTDGVNNWQCVSTEDKYYITRDDIGLYFKCRVTPKSDSLYESTGAPQETEVAGPVSDLLESTNLFVDPSFETTKIGECWDYQADGNAWEGVSLVKGSGRTGEYALRQPPRVSVSDLWYQDVPIVSGNVYVLGCYAKKASDKLTDTSGLWPYGYNDTQDRVETNKTEYTYTMTRRWQLCVGTFKARATRNAKFGFVSFETRDTLDALFDDMYFGELLISDIETYETGDILIPQVGETSVKFTSGKILNQLKTTHGLKNETVQYEIPYADGVYIKDGNLYITNKAKAGRISIRLYCVPTYAGANQSIFEKYVTVNLLPNNDTTPKAYDVTVSGDVASGNTLTGSYCFYQIDSKNDASTVCWTYCDTEDGQYAPIPNTNGLTTYTVESAYADKYIKFMVTPKTDDGMLGTDTYSNFVTNPRPPVASNVTITGDFNVGGSVTAEFDYYDPNGDAEGSHSYKWLIDGVGVHTGKTLTLTEDMIEKQIKVAVTPVSLNAPANGVEAWSIPVTGPCTPTAEYVSVVNNNGWLEGQYVYNHIHGIKESGTTFKWTVDGVSVSEKIAYLPNFSGRKTVTFTVTPKSAGNPSTGKPVSYSVVIGNVEGGSTGGFGGGGGSSSGGGIAGGGSGASGSGSGVTNINNMDISDPATKEPEKQPETPKSDIDNHWGKSYIEEMSKRGVITADENGNFNPDVNVTREEMVTYLFDALKLEATDYSNQFGDIADGDFAKKLQTMLDNGTIAKDVNFRPNDTISREEMCKILYVSLENAGKLNKVEDNLIASFADFDGISEWARMYVNAIYGNKIMVGVSDTEFDAKGTVTKAQAATMLVRILALTEVE